MVDPQTKDVAVQAEERRTTRPQPPAEITLDAILKRAGGKRMTPEEFKRHFGDLPTDGEG